MNGGELLLPFDIPADLLALIRSRNGGCDMQYQAIEGLPTSEIFEICSS